MTDSQLKRKLRFEGHDTYRCFPACSSVVTVPSPVGKPSRAIHNSFAEQAITDSSTRLERQCIANCLEACLCRDTGKTYCLLQALAKAARGDVEHGLIFSGANVRYTERIVSVAELMAELTQPQNPMLSK